MKIIRLLMFYTLNYILFLVVLNTYCFFWRAISISLGRQVVAKVDPLPPVSLAYVIGYSAYSFLIYWAIRASLGFHWWYDQASFYSVDCRFARKKASRAAIICVLIWLCCGFWGTPLCWTSEISLREIIFPGIAFPFFPFLISIVLFRRFIDSPRREPL